MARLTSKMKLFWIFALAFFAVPAGQPQGHAASPEGPKPANKPRKSPPENKPRSTAEPAAPGPTAAAILTRVKTYYAALKDYEAEFIQTYTKVALSQTTESRGVLQIKKPGFMRWSYSKPAEKVWIVDGDTLYVADPEFEQVYVDRRFKTAELERSISFLWGQGRLDEAFEARLGNPRREGLPPGFSLLVLKPRQGATYAELTLAVNSRTGEVVASTIYETAGNTNQFRFMKPKLNQGLPRSLFRFTTPEGWAVIEQ